MWIVGVENVRPCYHWKGEQEVEGIVVWCTATSRLLKKPPHRTRRFGSDELDLLVRFLHDCREVGYEVREPPCVT